MSERWLLPPLWFDLCWEIGAFDEYPFPLKLRSHGETLEERAVLKQRVWPEMAGANLIAGEGLAPAFGTVLAQIAKPGLWIEGMFMADDTNPSPVRLMCVAMERASILVVQHPGDVEAYGGDIQISVHPKMNLPAATLQGMPPTPAGKRPRVAALLSDLAPKRDEYGDLMVAPGPGGADQRAVKAVRELTENPHFRDGQFVANLRDPMGRTHRSAVFKWFDEAEPGGRYAVTQHMRSGLGQELVVAPLGPAELGKALENRVNEVRGAARGH